MKYQWIAILLVACIACKTQKDTDSTTGVQFLQSDKASDYLQTGDIDGYYDLMSPAHMSIQSRDTSSYATIDEQRKAYMQTIAQHTEDWSPTEMRQMQALMDTAFVLVQGLNPVLWPSDITMIKVDPVHYGNSVYYTIGDAIVWPSNIFENFSIDQQLMVALHEVWHLLGRDYPTLRDSLYREIGFYRHGYELELGPLLRERLLVNPDGVSLDYAIRLVDSTTNTSVEALPVVASRFSGYRPTMTSFFDYLHFDLHELKVQGSTAQVQIASDATSLLAPGFFPSFFTQIGDNTQYIIHPDEIIADNFVLAIKKANEGAVNYLSPEGKVLLAKMSVHLQQFKSE